MGNRAVADYLISPFLLYLWFPLSGEGSGGLFIIMSIIIRLTVGHAPKKEQWRVLTPRLPICVVFLVVCNSRSIIMTSCEWWLTGIPLRMVWDDIWQQINSMWQHWQREPVSLELMWAVGCHKLCSREYPLNLHNGSLVSDGQHGYRASNWEENAHLVARMGHKLEVCECVCGWTKATYMCLKWHQGEKWKWMKWK